LLSSAWALASAAASEAIESLIEPDVRISRTGSPTGFARRPTASVRRRTHWTGAWATSKRSKLTAPDFDRRARRPRPVASLASSGIKNLSSLLARLVLDMGLPGAANSAQLLEPLPRCGAGRLDPEQARVLAALNAAPELSLGRQQQVLVERIGRDGDLERLAAGGCACENPNGEKRTGNPPSTAPTPLAARRHRGQRWQCAPKARIISGGRFHPESCRFDHTWAQCAFSIRFFERGVIVGWCSA
jgi:hypothetical protein